MADLTAIIHACCIRLEIAIGKLRTQKNTLDDCIEINRLENSADELVRRLVTDLFNEERDPIALMKNTKRFMKCWNPRQTAARMWPTCSRP